MVTLTAKYARQTLPGKVFPARRVSDGATLMAPIGGWDAVSPLAGMPPENAVLMENWFPQPGWIEARNGSAIHASCGTTPVETVMAWNGVSGSKLFAAIDDTIYDATLPGIASADVTGLGSARYQHLVFANSGGNFLVACNGVNPPQVYNGAWTVATLTGGDANPISVNLHKRRLWYIPDNSTAPEYLGINEYQGALTAFELGPLMSLGGYVMAMGTWSVDGGNGPDDYAVFVTSRGQAIIYSGTDPSSVDSWSLVGVFNLGSPIGRRCLLKVGADLAVISIDGVLPLSKAMIFERAAVTSAALTQNIQPAMNQSARNYKDNFGWQLVSYPKGTRAILNIPILEGVQSEQYVMNTIAGKWCKFVGMNAACWETMDDRLFFGGIDGNVHEADIGGTDNGQPIHCDTRQAFNYYGVMGLQKRWSMCQVNLTTDFSVTPYIAFNIDFGENAPLSPITREEPLGGIWDVDLWDAGIWGGQSPTVTDWCTVAGIGQCASIRLVADVFTGTQKPILRINSFNVIFEKGAFI